MYIVIARDTKGDIFMSESVSGNYVFHIDNVRFIKMKEDKNVFA